MSGSPASAQDAALRRRLLLLLVAVLSIEALILAGVVALLVYEQFTEVPLSRSSSIALLVLAVLGLAFLVAVALAAWRRAPWVRSGAVTWQVLQLAAAWVALQGDIANGLGWVLVALAALGIVAAVHPAVQRELLPRDR